MNTVHMTVGSLVLLAFLASTIVNILRLTGRQISWARQLSFLASGLLFLQYVLGFSLLGGDSSITPFHYIIALLAIIPVGVEHAVAPQRTTPTEQAKVALPATAVTTILVLIAYLIGESAK
ncbi:MAG TPA: hypothetical protein VIL01_10005 [Thermomicrobiales bacterium]